MNYLSNYLLVFYTRLSLVLLLVSIVMLQSCTLCNPLNRSKFGVNKPGQVKKIKGVIEQKKIITVREQSTGILNGRGIVLGTIDPAIDFAINGITGSIAGYVAEKGAKLLMSMNDTGFEKYKVFRYIVALSFLDQKSTKSKKVKTKLVKVIQTTNNNLDVGDKVYVVVTNEKGKNIITLTKREIINY